jgi:hypothetical protein
MTPISINREIVMWDKSWKRIIGNLVADSIEIDKWLKIAVCFLLSTFFLVPIHALAFEYPLLFVVYEEGCKAYTDSHPEGIPIPMGKVFKHPDYPDKNLKEVSVYLPGEEYEELKTFYKVDSNCGALIIDDYKLATKRVEKILDSKFGLPVKKELMKGKVWVGMTKDQAILAWGNPDTVNTTETSSGKKYQLVFIGGRYLYVENGIVTSIQNKE